MNWSRLARCSFALPQTCRSTDHKARIFAVGDPMESQAVPMKRSWKSQDPQTCFAAAVRAPRPPVVGGISPCSWLHQDAHSHFHKWRVESCARPSSLSPNGSQDFKREQHLTGRRERSRWLELQARLFRAMDGLSNVRVEGADEHGIRGRHWGKDRGVGYPVLTWSLGRCTCSYIDTNRSAPGDHPICGGRPFSYP